MHLLFFCHRYRLFVNILDWVYFLFCYMFVKDWIAPRKWLINFGLKYLKRENVDFCMHISYFDFSNQLIFRLRGSTPLKRPYPSEESDEITIIGEVKRKPIPVSASSPQLAAQIYPEQLERNSAERLLEMNASTSSIPAVIEGQQHVMVRQDTTPVKSNEIFVPRKLIVKSCGSVKPCGSNTFFLSATEGPAIENSAVACENSTASSPGPSFYEEPNRGLKVAVALEAKQETVKNCAGQVNSAACFASTTSPNVPQTCIRCEPTVTAASSTYPASYSPTVQALQIDGGSQQMPRKRNNAYEAYDALFNGAFDSPNNG